MVSVLLGLAKEQEREYPWNWSSRTKRVKNFSTGKKMGMDWDLEGVPPYDEDRSLERGGRRKRHVGRTTPQRLRTSGHTTKDTDRNPKGRAPQGTSKGRVEESETRPVL